MTNIRLENLYIWIKILKRIYSFVLLGIWGWFFYQCYQTYLVNKTFLLRFTDLSFLEDKTILDPALQFAIHCGKLIGFFIAALIIYSIIKKFFRIIPIHTLFINKWNNTNQISPMFAHRLINHYTFNTTLSFYTLFNIYEISKFEASILSYNFNNKNLEGLFKRFEPQLVGEINIYNTYFPPMSSWQKIKTFFTGKPYRKIINNNDLNHEHIEPILNENKTDIHVNQINTDENNDKINNPFLDKNH